MALRVKEMRPADMDPALRTAWADFIRDGAATHPFMSSPFMLLDFANAVAEVRTDARVMVAEDESGPIAFLPCHRRPMQLARPIGAPFNDLHGPIMRPGAAVDMATMLRALGLSAYAWSAMPADFVPADVIFDSCAYWSARIGDDGEAWMAARRAEHRERFKGFAKRLRRAEREVGPISVTMDDADPAVFDWIVAMKRAQFAQTRKHDVLAAPWAQAMLGSLRNARTPDFGLRVSTMRFGDALVAGQINLLGAGVLHSWIIAHDPAMSDYAPGMQIMQEVIAGAGSLGATRVDLGGHHDAYKRLFAEPLWSVTEGQVCAAGSTGAVRRLSGAAWRKAEAAKLGPVSALAGKLRRRGAQIASTELEFSGRIRGALNALSGRGVG